MPNVSRAKNLTRRRTLSSHLVKIFPPREENPFTLHPFTLHLSEKKTKSDRVQRRKPSAHSQLVITLSPFREENPPRVTIHRAKKTLSENPPALRESKTLTIAKIAPQSPLTPTHHSPLNTDRRSSSPSCTDRRAPPIPSRAAHTVVDLCASRRPLCAHVVDRKPEKFAGPQFTSSPVTSSFQLLRSQWITIMRNDVLMEKDLFCPRYVKYYIWRDQIQFQVYKEAHQKIQFIKRKQNTMKPGSAAVIIPIIYNLQ
ncbi:hypothetical protein Ahy_A03g012022 isoform D [Arachis hypogaea]|uniref:Uncharacterized protein n=1 Tax=Arachis hypogaea TaxID=3818 RepID=A0A445DSG7_ARAHY|nr:hypothetical protein Ahy_A03g012022 isoform D [Arachis hypogaea]